METALSTILGAIIILVGLTMFVVSAAGLVKWMYTRETTHRS